MLPHVPFPERSFGCVVDDPEGMGKAVRMFLKYGVDQVKLNLSGDNLVPGADALTSWMSDEEVADLRQAVKERRPGPGPHPQPQEAAYQRRRDQPVADLHAVCAAEAAPRSAPPARGPR